VSKKLIKIPNRLGKKCQKTAGGGIFLTHTVQQRINDLTQLQLIKTSISD